MPVTVPKKDIWRAVRAKCLDCCCGQQTEVDQCPVTKCPLWLYRYGKSMQSREKRLAYLREKASNTETESKESTERYNLLSECKEETSDNTESVENENQKGTASKC